MFSNIPFKEVNWITSSFLIFSFFTTIIGVPIYVSKMGIEPVLLIFFFLYFIATGISITLGYHRLFAHKSFKATSPVKLFTLLFGAAAFEDSALDWASDHRTHHKHVDHETKDPYSITKGFFWAHMGWIFFKLYPRKLNNVNDLKKDPIVMFQHKFHLLIGIIIAFVIPTLIGFIYNEWIGALGGFLIIGIARITAVQHCTFFINSLCHMIGKRPYDTTTSARDSWVMAIFTFGEGYHNYHHRFQHDYRNGVKKWQWDPTKWTIYILNKLKLVSDLRTVSEETIILLELSEMQKKISTHLNDSKVIVKNSPKYEQARTELINYTKILSKGYHEVEKSITNKVKLSSSKIAYLRHQMSISMNHLSMFKGLSFSQ